MTDKKLPQRNELPQEMTWNLEIMYKNSKEWEDDFSKIPELLEKFMAFKGKLKDSAAMLRDAIEASDAMERLAEKVYVYAHLRSDEDTADSKNRSKVDRASALFAEISGKTAWFDPEIMEIHPEVMAQFLQAEDLAFYKRSLEELLRERPHTLSEKEERILGMSSDVMSTPSKTFSMLNNADLRFPEINNESGTKVEMTHGNYIKFLECSKREVRKDAFEGMYDTYNKFRNTFSSTLDGTIKRHVLGSKIRNHKSALGSALFGDNIPEEVYRNLIQAVHDKLPALHKYMQLRCDALKLDKLDMYDIFCPLVPECKVEVTWQEAVKWVREALKPMGKEYCNTLEKTFEQRWVDIMECRGKRSGAYSSGCYDSYPYLLLNFHGTLNDVFTLAHELGHSMHSYYSHHAQEYHYADYRIFVAEVASTTNEQLLHQYLMKNTQDKNLKAYLLCHLLDELRGTIYRQTQFAEFELWMHEQSEQGVPLTPDVLSEKYFELNKLYYGDSVNSDQRIEMEWARIPHFYYNFYVYKYATGISAAVELSQNILSGDSRKIEDYFGFLKAGDSKDVLDIMKDAGVDLSTPKPVHDALDLFDKTVDQLRELLEL
ncbi:MAG: oligoendopeptidase F [Lentisphaerae bacterium]|nr:oligoendopeptidase F [Lentisphaerota bacterium]MCP4101981.1 oligoendopeptidase F [Lentisphaerota bacterium]